MIYELTDTSKAAKLFEGWEQSDIYACLQGVMGTICVTDPDNPRSATAVIGDFVYCAGEPDLELLQGKPDRWMLVVPQNDEWARLIESSFPAYKRIRYAIRKDTKFDREKLEAMVRALPEGYELRRIDDAIYEMCMADEDCRDFVSVFGSKEKFFELGRGFVVMKDGKIVAGASSYSRYREGVELEVGTGKAERHKGIGSAVCAAMILSCLDAGLYPSWDAANMMSVRLAEKLGYELSHEYICFTVE